MINRLSLVRKFFDQSAQAGNQWNASEIKAVERSVQTHEHTWHETVRGMLMIAKELDLQCLDEVRRVWNQLRPPKRIRMMLRTDEVSKAKRLDYLDDHRQPVDDIDLLEIAQWATTLTFPPSYSKIMTKLTDWDILLAAQVVVERNDRAFAEKIAQLATSGNPPKAEAQLQEWDALVIMADAGLLEDRWTRWITSRRRPEQGYTIIMS